MKKLVYLFIACAMATFASCGNRTNAHVEAVDSDTVVADTVADTLISADSVCVL